jgi:hypothetical protein
MSPGIPFSLAILYNLYKARLGSFDVFIAIRGAVFQQKKWTLSGTMDDGRWTIAAQYHRLSSIVYRQFPVLFSQGEHAMTQPASFTLQLAAEMPADQREALLDALAGQSVELREVEARDPDSDWLTFLAIGGGVVVAAEGVKAVAGAANETIKLAETIKSWRAKCRAAKVTPAARLEAPGRPPLDLATAGDDEVLAWFLEGPAG